MSDASDSESTPAGPGEHGLGDYEFDVFVCHASEDKLPFVAELARLLQTEHVAVWYDDFSLQVGDSIPEKIDEGLRRSRFGIVVLSDAFFRRPWPRAEMDSLLALEGADGQKRILPIWLNVSHAQVSMYSSLLGARLGIATDGMDPEAVARRIADRVHGARRDIEREFARIHVGERILMHEVPQVMGAIQHRHFLRCTLVGPCVLVPMGDQNLFIGLTWPGPMAFWPIDEHYGGWGGIGIAGCRIENCDLDQVGLAVERSQIGQLSSSLQYGGPPRRRGDAPA